MINFKYKKIYVQSRGVDKNKTRNNEFKIIYANHETDNIFFFF